MPLIPAAAGTSRNPASGSPARPKFRPATRQTFAGRHEESRKAIIACSSLAIYSIDPEGKVTNWNESAQRIFGWAAAEVPGRFLPIVHEDRSDEFAGLVRCVLAGEVLAGLKVQRFDEIAFPARYGPTASTTYLNPPRRARGRNPQYPETL